MLKRKAMKKIMITTLTVCLLLVIYLMPSSITSQDEKQNMEVKYSDNIEKLIFIYFLKKNYWLWQQQ